MCADQVGHLAHLHARHTSFALVSGAPVAAIERYRHRMGWAILWWGRPLGKAQCTSGFLSSRDS